MLKKKNWEVWPQNLPYMYGIKYVWINKCVENVSLFLRKFVQRAEDMYMLELYCNCDFYCSFKFILDQSVI